MNKMNQAQQVKEISFAGYNIPVRSKPRRVFPVEWLRERALDLNLITMATTPKQPNGFFVNMTTIGSLIIITTFLGGIIVGLYKFTYDTAYQKGVSDTKQESLQKELESLKRKQFEETERLDKLTVPKPDNKK